MGLSLSSDLQGLGQLSSPVVWWQGDSKKWGQKGGIGQSGRRGADEEEAADNRKGILVLRRWEKRAAFSESESLFVKIQKQGKNSSFGWFMRVLWTFSLSVFSFVIVCPFFLSFNFHTSSGVGLLVCGWCQCGTEWTMLGCFWSFQSTWGGGIL